MYRALIEIDEGGTVLLSEEELHHLVRVRRAKSGHPFVGLDGRGSSFLCALEQSPRGWVGRIVRPLTDPRESPLKVTLGQALIKKDKFEWVVQKAAELGVSEIVPLLTERTELRLEGSRTARRMERWQRILEGTIKQCGRARVPMLSDPVEVTDFLSGNDSPLKLALDEGQGYSLKEVIEQNGEVSCCAVLVGPEGGWDDRDREILHNRKVVPVHLGPRILRAETAAVTILSILQYELGDLS